MDFNPMSLRDEFDAIDKIDYKNINNGIYRDKFATKQIVYDKAYHLLVNTEEVCRRDTDKLTCI